MEVEDYFKPALELGRLVWEYNQAAEEQRARLGRQIYYSDYLVRLRTFQSLTGVEFLRGKLPAQKVNTIRKDIFYNPAVPSFRRDREAAAQTMPYHRHDYLELVIVLRGQYTQSINGILHHHSEGDICMLNPNVTHRDVTPGLEDRVLFLGLSSNYVGGELARGLQPHPKLAAFMEYQNGRREQQYVLFHPPEWEAVEALILQIMEEDTLKLPGHHAVIGGLLVRLFSRLVEGDQYTICRQSAAEINENLIAEVLAYMRENLSGVNREELAAFFHFNPDYLNRLLLQVTGWNYSTHLREMRLEQAADQLRHTELSVNTIIRELGFANKGYFNRIFREKYGVLPGEYRRQ